MFVGGTSYLEDGVGVCVCQRGASYLMGCMVSVCVCVCVLSNGAVS